MQIVAGERELHAIEAPASAQSGAALESPPRIRTAKGWVNSRQSEATLERVRARSEKAEQSPVLDEQLAVEEYVSGSPLVAGNKVTLLTDGPTTYGAMLDAIRGAKRYVYLESYILENDEIGERFATALIERSKAGIPVALMVDAIGTLSTPDTYFQRLRDAGIEVRRFNSLRSWRFWRANERDHRKVLVVDGNIGFTGGFNITAVYSSRPGLHNQKRKELEKKDAPWRDTHIRIVGPAALDLEREFVEGWTEQGGDPLPRTAPTPPRTTSVVPEGELVRVITSAPDETSAIYWTLLSAISKAQRSVHITMAYFVPDAQFRRALKEAAARGVDVTLILPGFSDFWMVFQAGRSHYEELLDAKISIYERTDALLHAKTVVIDGVWSTVGSSNMDWRSFVHNHEINAVVLGPDFGKEMEKLFEHDIGESKRVTLEEWQKRPWSDRFKEDAAWLFSYWL